MQNFKKIIGYETEKEELARICDLMKNKEKYAVLGVKMPRAILLHGEPGLGKTLMAEALIQESGRKCFSCKKDRADGAFVDKIRATFESAIKNEPSIVFLDDMDKFAQDNLSENNNKEEFVAIQSCLEDLKEKEVFVIATANDITNIPYSLLREGRFGKQLKIEMPSKEDLVKIIAHFLEKKAVSENVSADFVANLLEGKSCAFLESVVNEAGIYAGYENKTKIDKKHFIDAVMRLSTKRLPSEKTENTERRMTCYHEAGHAVAAIYSGKEIALLTSRRHGEIGGFCSTVECKKEFRTFEELRNEIIIFLSGKASTDIIYNAPDLCAESDITEASRLARYYIEKLAIKGFAYLYDGTPYSGKQPVKRIEEITDKIAETLEELYAESIALLRKNQKLLERIAEALFKKETLLWEDISDLADQINT